MKLFEKIFYKKLKEMNVAGAGGVFGDAPSMGHGGAVGNTDFYNSNSTIIPTGPGKSSESKKDKKKKKKNKSKEVGVNMLLPVQRRPLNRSM